MRFWLISLPREDMQHCIKIGTFGLNRKYTMGNLRKGDNVVCYVTKESKIIALGKATSDYYIDDKRIFRSEGIYPDRFDFQAELLLPNQQFEFKSIIDDLHFIQNKYYWAAYLRTGIVEIPETDWKILKAKSDLLPV